MRPLYLTPDVPLDRADAFLSDLAVRHLKFLLPPGLSTRADICNLLRIAATLGYLAGRHRGEHGHDLSRDQIKERFDQLHWA